MMDYRVIKFFMYDKKIMKSIIKSLSAHLNDFKDNGQHFIVQRGWKQGAHLGVAYDPKNTSTSKEFRDYVYNYFLKLQDRMSNEIDIEDVDYEKYEKMIHNVAILEGYEGKYLPLLKNLTIIEDEVEIGSSLKGNTLVLNEEIIRTKFLLQAIEYYEELENSEKSVFLLKLFTILGDYKTLLTQTSEPINESYLSFKSHCEGFKTQLSKYSENQRNMIISKLEPNSEEERSFVYQDFSLFLDEYRKGFTNSLEKETKILIGFQESLMKLDSLFNIAIDCGDIQLTKEHSLTEFLNSNHQNLSEFHKFVVKNVDIEFFSSDENVLGRLLVNWFYNLLPLLSVSPLEKNKLCNCICLAVENKENKNYRDFILEFTHTLEGSVRK